MIYSDDWNKRIARVETNLPLLKTFYSVKMPFGYVVDGKRFVEMNLSICKANAGNFYYEPYLKRLLAYLNYCYKKQNEETSGMEDSLW